MDEAAHGNALRRPNGGGLAPRCTSPEAFPEQDGGFISVADDSVYLRTNAVNAELLFGLGILTMANWSSVSGQDDIIFHVDEAEIVATWPQLAELGLNWFIDGNLGVLKSDDARFKYLSGGPVNRDPETERILLFYHAEMYPSTARNFCSAVGLAVQADQEGLVFQDLGPVFVANIPEEEAVYPVEICGAPFVFRDGDFLVYAGDELQPEGVVSGDRVGQMAEINEALERDGYVKVSGDFDGGQLRQSNLSVARARASKVLEKA